MKIQCAWCKKDMGEKPPYEDKGITHTICPECLKKYFPRGLLNSPQPVYQEQIQTAVVSFLKKHHPQFQNYPKVKICGEEEFYQEYERVNGEPLIYEGRRVQMDGFFDTEGNTIVYRGIPDSRTVLHELAHWVQLQTHGEDWMNDPVNFQEQERDAEEVEDKFSSSFSYPAISQEILLPKLKPFDAYEYARYVLENNMFRDDEIDYYSGKTGLNPHGIPDEVWARALKELGGQFIPLGSGYILTGQELAPPPGMKAPPPRDIWNLESTDLPSYDQMMKDPDYFREEKGIIGRIEYFTPQRYMIIAAQLHGVRPEREYEMLDAVLVDKYVQDMRAGAKFPVPVLDFIRKDQEGRHRVAAAARIGEHHVPVFTVRGLVESESSPLYTHPLVLARYPLGAVPEKIPLDGFEAPIPPLKGTELPSKKTMVVARNAVIRTNEKFDSAVEHLGYEPVSLSQEELETLEKSIPTDVELINDSQKRLRETEVIPDEKLSPRQKAHLELARVIAKDTNIVAKPAQVYAAIIPPASDRARTGGMYGTSSQAVYVNIEQLYRARDTIDILVHELGHHVQWLRTGTAEDLVESHAEAMTLIASLIVERIAEGAYQEWLKLAEWY